MAAENNMKEVGSKENAELTNIAWAEGLIHALVNKPDPALKHDETMNQIESVFREFGFYTTREYPIFKMKDGSNRSGRIDLVARKGKFRIALEYDHRRSVKYKSFQKIVQIKPEEAVAITGNGTVEYNIKRALKYQEQLTMPLYVISLKERTYRLLQPLDKGGIMILQHKDYK